MSESEWSPSTGLPPCPVTYPYVYRPANYWISWLAVVGMSGVVIGLNDPMHLYSVYEGEPAAPFSEDLQWWGEFCLYLLLFHFLGIRPRVEYPSAHEIRIFNPLRTATIRRSDIATVDTRVGWARINLRSGKRVIVAALEEWNSPGLVATHRELAGMVAGDADRPSVSVAETSADPHWRFQRLTWEDAIVAIIVFGYPGAAALVRHL